jgi:hypothetical protein
MKAKQKPLLEPLIPWKMTPSTGVWFGYRIDAEHFTGELGFGFESDTEMHALLGDAFLKEPECIPSRVRPDHSLDISFAETFMDWSKNLFWEIAWAAELEQPIPNPKVIDEALVRGKTHAQSLLRDFRLRPLD